MESMKSKKIPAFFKPFIAEDREQRLRVLTDVIRDLKLKLPKHIDICDEGGRTWSAAVLLKGGELFGSGMESSQTISSSANSSQEKTEVKCN
ncbi:hypothetical protein AgCh_001168 [Apium graveolens]